MISCLLLLHVSCQSEASVPLTHQVVLQINTSQVQTALRKLGAEGSLMFKLDRCSSFFPFVKLPQHVLENTECPFIFLHTQI